MLHSYDSNDLMSIEGIRVEGARALYLIFLARWPETDAAQRASGMSAAEFIKIVIASPEFREIVEEAAAADALPRHDALGSKELAVAAGWLAERKQMPAHSGFEGWAGLLQVATAHPSLGGVFDAANLSEFLTLIADLARHDEERCASLRAYFRFDPDWFLQAQRDLRVLRCRRDDDDLAGLAVQAVIEADAQVLAAFSTGLGGIYESLRGEGDLALDDILRRTLKGLRDGAISHWLFDAEHYRWSLGRHGGANALARGIGNASYIDYLSRGEDEGLSPHPLFSGYAAAQSRSAPPLLGFLLQTSPRATPGAIFDPDFYLSFDTEAAAAIREGSVGSALEHFLRVGILREAPFSPDFDAAFYAQRYPEVAEAVAGGSVPSLSWHFVFRGLREGRQPNPYFDPAYYKWRHPGVVEEMERLRIGSELEHFLVLGRARGWKCCEPLVAGRPPQRDAKVLFQKRARRSFDSLLRRQKSFASRGAAAPAISIVVPVCGEMEFTAHFLLCAHYALVHLHAERGVDGEVVVVDNGSRDATSRLLARCPGVVVAGFAERLGFPRAVNEGVRRSVGAVVVVANNDIEFAPDALVTILDRLAARPDVGILGGITILPDETIQEAGSFLDHTGDVTALGRGDDPWDGFYGGENDADYCTGSFIAFRRGDFDELGGFDEAFSPGYYEETDFALRMAATLGKGACVDGSLQIVHFEHASFASGRPPTYAAALIRKNRALLLGKHRDELARRSTQRGAAPGRDVAPAVLGRHRVLVIEDMVPDHRLGSGFGRAAEVLHALVGRGIALEILALYPTPLGDEFADPRVRVHRAWMLATSVDRFLDETAHRYSHILVCRTHNLRRLAPVLERLRRREGLRIVCDTEALATLRRREFDGLVGKAVPAEEASDLRHELDVGVLVSTWIAVSRREREAMERVGVAPVLTIGYGLDIDGPTMVAGRTRILAVGAVHDARTPNYDALAWFVERVIPRRPTLLEDFTLTVVGHWDPGALARFRSDYAHVRFEMRGIVSAEELDRLYGEARVCLAPTRYAAGVPIKVLEAFARGVPIVVTELLARQVAATGTAGLAVAKTGDEADFARWLTMLCLDDVAWRQVAEQQRHVLEAIAGRPVFERAVGELVAREFPGGRDGAVPEMDRHREEGRSDALAAAGAEMACADVR